MLFSMFELSYIVLVYRMAKEGLSNEERFERGEGTSHVAIWSKNVPNRKMTQKP